MVDLNFQVGYIAVGLIFKYEVKDLLRIEVPIDTQFSFHDVEDWHLYIGSLRNKASAEILGIAKGTAYLMFDGKGIPDFPLVPLNGFSIAAGIARIAGHRRRKLGAVRARLRIGRHGRSTRDPLHFFGRMRLEGRIHLWFIGLGASAELGVEAPVAAVRQGRSVRQRRPVVDRDRRLRRHHDRRSAAAARSAARSLSALSLQSHSPALDRRAGH